MRIDIFEKLVKLESCGNIENLSAERRRALDHMISEGRRNGNYPNAPWPNPAVGGTEFTDYQ